MLLGIEDAELYALTGIDPWFLAQIRQIVVMEQTIRNAPALDADAPPPREGVRVLRQAARLPARVR